ncbi:PilZ domain-containing protein [uncultured Erythrobacter sp.]|uniref:PilZ domain-containing protein n=1 Tax=uncultured Erythrobacter sp. TaxID=263913 RepID=UPI00260A21C6|nr:PilZ domain-containing protein [uncultured Erythrobacter sp.]
MSSLAIRQQAVQSERRRSSRLVAEIPVGLRTVSGLRECRMANISDEGAKLELADPPAEGVSGWLVLDGTEIYCKIIWSNESACGIEFERSLGDYTLKQIVGTQDLPTGPAANRGNIQAGRKRSGLVSRG